MQLPSAKVPVCFCLGVSGLMLLSNDPGGIDRAAWLTGCWETSDVRRTIHEQWMPPAGHTMLSMARTIGHDSLTDYELVILREAGDRLIFEAHPAGQDTASFASTLVSDTSLVFENPEHDFPRRIGYRRVGADSLVAWIDGGAGSRRIEFPYRRARCGGE